MGIVRGNIFYIYRCTFYSTERKPNAMKYWIDFVSFCCVNIQSLCIYIGNIELLTLLVFQSTFNQLFGSLWDTIVQGSHIPAFAYTFWLVGKTFNIYDFYLH